MITFRVFVNKKKKWAVNLRKEVVTFLRNAGFKEAVKDKPDYSIIIGGDGTLFYYLDKIAGKIIVIGSEKSYRAQLTRNNWKNALLKLMKRKSIKLPLLTVTKNERIISKAINDVVFHTNDHKIVEIEMNIDGKSISFIGDGLIISTPFGSTGYSYSAGGKNLTLNSTQICVTPICPYLRKVNPFTVTKGAHIKVKPSKNTSLIIDGKVREKSCHGEYTVAVDKNEIEYVLK